MGLFPTDASDAYEVTNANGTTFIYVAADDKWVVKGVAGYSAAEVDAIVADYLPLAGGEISGNITCAGAQTIDTKDVSTLCTVAEAHAYVEANALALTANLTTNGLIDGQDIAAMAADLANQCTPAEAHAYIEANEVTFEAFPITPSAAPDANYEVANKKYVDDIIGGESDAAHLMIGAANAAYVNCPYADTAPRASINYDNVGFRNTGAVDFVSSWDIPLPTNRGGLKLYATAWTIEVMLADASDYIDRIKLYGRDTGGATWYNPATDASNLTTAGDHEYVFPAAVDLSNTEKWMLWVECFSTTALHLNVNGIAIKVYYDT